MNDSKRSHLSASVFAVIIAIFVVLGYSFFPIWRGKADGDAQAYAAFLSYVATATTVLVTLIYVYFTRESLLAAKAAFDLQREQWQHSIATEPRFWIEKKRVAGNYILGCKQNGRTDSFSFDDFDCVVWNYSDKSILISSINLTDGLDAKCIGIQKVLLPHTVERFSFGLRLLEFYVPDITSPSRGGTEACIVLTSYARQIGEKSVLLSLTYSDWMHRDAESETYRFSIQKATSEQSLNPAALAILPNPRLEDEADQNV